MEDEAAADSLSLYLKRIPIFLTACEGSMSQVEIQVVGVSASTVAQSKDPHDAHCLFISVASLLCTRSPAPPPALSQL